MKAVFLPDFSGGNPYQRELKNHLEERGVSVGLASIHRSSSWTHRLFPLIGAVRDNGGFDVLHVHWIHPFFAHRSQIRAVLGGIRLVFELLVLRLLDVPVVWTIHNLLDHDHRLPESLEIAIRHATFRLVDRVIVHCDEAGETVVAAYHLPASAGDRIVTIPHGHYLDSYPNGVGRTQARESLGYNSDETVFLYFGRIRRYKNVPALISAFTHLKRDDARLLVVGKPSSENLTEDIVSRSTQDDRVRTVLEFVPADEVQRYMNAADVVVLPFEGILSSGSALLAMSFGRPVVAPAMGCVTPLLAGELTYDPTDSTGLVATMERALEVNLQTIGRRNKRRASEFDWSTVAARTEATYRAVTR